MPVRAAHLSALASVLLLSACGLTDSGAFVDHDEASDFEPVDDTGKADGLPATFDRHLVLSDEFFTAVGSIDGDGLQRFFEATPYGTRSWLADETIGGQRAADAIVAAAEANGINPIVMVARMQVEKSMVSPTKRPRQSRIDFAFGCGCPDGGGCSSRFKGLDKQVDCAASTLSRWYHASEDGSGQWRKGVSRRTLDPLTVTPKNHATASMYSYTPWVLVGRGGNWLVWNVTRRFANHAADLGLLQPAPTAALAASWQRLDDGSYALFAHASADVVRVEYRVDDIVIGSATRADGDDFPANRVFNHEGPNRPFEARGFDQAGRWVALGNGLLDVGDAEAPYLRQTASGEYEIGLERAGADVAAIEVSADDFTLTDLDSGEQRSTRLAVRSGFTLLGERHFLIRVFDAAGRELGSYQRTLTLR